MGFSPNNSIKIGPVFKFKKNFHRQSFHNIDITKVSFSKETLEEIIKDHMVNYDGNEYLIIEVIALTEPDQYGKTLTAYISKKVAAPKGGQPND